MSYGFPGVNASGSTFNDVTGNQYNNSTNNNTTNTNSNNRNNTANINSNNTTNNIIYNIIYANDSYSGAVTHNPGDQIGTTLEAHHVSEASGLHSVGGGATTYVTFVNDLGVEVRIDWINFTGERQQFFTLPPGQSYRQQTFVGHPWIVSTGSKPIALYYPTSQEARAVINVSVLALNNLTSPSYLKPFPASNSTLRSLRSGTGGASTFVTFVNTLTTSVRVYWIDFQGNKVLYSTLSPDKSYRQQTYVGHPWVVFTGSDESPTAIFYPLPSDSTALIGANLFGPNDTASPSTKPSSKDLARVSAAAKDNASSHGLLKPSPASSERSLRSSSGGASTSVTFINALSVSAQTYWIDFNGNRVLYKTLSPGQSYTQQTYVGHPWIVCVEPSPDAPPIAIFHPSSSEGNALIGPSLLDTNV